jgi:hypothetical protein
MGTHVAPHLTQFQHGIHVPPYAHSQQMKVLNHHIMYETQFKRFFRLNHSVVAWFAHLQLPKHLGSCLPHPLQGIHNQDAPKPIQDNVDR